VKAYGSVDVIFCTSDPGELGGFECFIFGNREVKFLPVLNYVIKPYVMKAYGEVKV
jgi:hypothetical protein